MLEVILVSTFLWIGDQIEKTFFQFFLFHDFMNGTEKESFETVYISLRRRHRLKENKKYCKHMGIVLYVQCKKGEIE